MKFTETDMGDAFPIKKVGYYVDEGYPGVYVLSRDGQNVH